MDMASILEQLRANPNSYLSRQQADAIDSGYQGEGANPNQLGLFVQAPTYEAMIQAGWNPQQYPDANAWLAQSGLQYGARGGPGGQLAIFDPRTGQSLADYSRTNDNTFWNGALAAGALVGASAGGLFSGGSGATVGGAGAADGALALTGLESTSPLLSAGIPAAPAAGGLGGASAGAAGGGLGLSGAFGSAPGAATGFYAPTFGGAAGSSAGSLSPLAKAGIQAGGGLLSTYLQGQGAKDAASIQAGAAGKGAQTMRDVYAQVLQQLQPYAQGGVSALQGQQNLIGLGGNQAQSDAIAQLQSSPEFAALTKQGEDAILANASATGGLRGGNVQAALGQFRPQVLSSLINQQYTRLGGLSASGQNAAVGVGNAAIGTGGSIAGLQQQAGAAQAGGALAQGRTNAGYINNIYEALGLFAGMEGGF
jgi:hypothetical protein